MRSSEERGIRLRPHAWISSEWFSPDSTILVSLSPSSLAHPRLMKLEKKMMLDVEGRHLVRVHGHSPPQAGHTVQQAHQLHRR